MEPRAISYKLLWPFCRECLTGDAMPVREQLLQLSFHEPSRKKFPGRAHGQIVFDAIFEPASRGAVRNKSMRMFPATERARTLEILEFASFHISAVLEFPPHAERPHAHSECAVRAIANSGGGLQNFNRLPRRRQPLERAGLRVPREDLLRWSLDARSSNKSLTHDGGVSI